MSSTSLVKPLISNNNSSNTNIKPRSWYSISILLENASSSSTPSSTLSSTISNFIIKNQIHLISPQDPFPTLNNNKTKLLSGKITVYDINYNLNKLEQDLILEISNKYEIDEILSFISFKNLNRLNNSNEKLAEEEWSNITKFIFGERMAIIVIVGLLLRCQDDESHPCFELANQLLPSILIPSFTINLLNSFQFRTQQNLPPLVRSSSTSVTSFWTGELIREQKALLEISFVVYYTGISPSGLEMLTLFNVISSTNWGRNQELFGYFNVEIKKVVEDISSLLNIIAIESLNLETSTTRDFPIPSPIETPLPPTDMYHPQKLTELNQAVEVLANVDRTQSSPILIAWAFILSRIANSFTERGVPNAYQTFATLSLRNDSNSSSTSGATSPPQPLFQLYAAHALAPQSNLFSTLLSILQSPLFGQSNSTSEDPNLVGYISVLRALITCLPLLVRLSYLTSEQYSGLVEVFSTLYENPAAAQYCVQFWEDRSNHSEVEEMRDIGVDAEGENEIVDLAKARFPVQFGSLLNIFKSVTKGVDGLLLGGGIEELENERALGKKCARSAFHWFGTLQELTSIVVPTSTLTPLPYELVVDFEVSSAVTYRSTRPIPISKSLTIPVGTSGRLVSQQGRKPVVISWDLEWSGWKLLNDVLVEEISLTGEMVGGDVFGSTSQVVGLPIEWNDQAEKERDIISILEIFSTLLLQDPSLGTSILEQISSSNNLPQAQQMHFVEIIFQLLSKSLSSTNKFSTKLVSSLLKVIAALLPSYPGVIWTFLRGSTLLFPSISSPSAWNPESFRPSILQQEKLSGQYSVTLSLLSLVNALVLEDQISSNAISTEFEELKQEVLVRAMTWCRDEVWSNLSTWRFINLGEKFELTKKVVEIYRLILDEGELSPGTENCQFDPLATFVVDSLLINATSTRLAPLLSSIISIPPNSNRQDFNLLYLSDELLYNSLELIAQLLRLRRRINSLTSSLLEKICLTEGVSSISGLNRSEVEISPLFSIIRIITSQENSRNSMIAAKVITLLCISTSDGSLRPPSFVTLLGGSKCGEEVVGKLLEVLEDSEGLEKVKAAIWDMISSFVESQPSLAMLFVTGRPYPTTDSKDKGKEKEVTVVDKISQIEEDARALAKSLAPSPFQPLSRTAIGVALETIGLWNEAWEDTPILLAAVLRFFDFTWQHLVDFGPALDEFRSLPVAWDNLVEIAFKDLGADPTEESTVANYCYRTMSKAHAVRILALDIQGIISRFSSPKLPSSAVALFKGLSSLGRLSTALVGNQNGAGAIHTSCAPMLHQRIFGLITETFPEVSIEALRLPSPSHPLDDTREFGPSYLYSLPHLRRKLDGFMSDSSSTIQIENLVDVITRTSQVNLNFSKLEAQISNTRSWRQLLEISLPLLKRDPSISKAFSTVALSVSEVISHEDRVGLIITTVHEERLSILLTIVEVLPTTPTLENNEELVVLLTNVSDIFSSVYLPPLDSVARRISPIFHSTLFRIAYFLFRHLHLSKPDRFIGIQVDRISLATDHILRIMITATRDLFVLARSIKTIELQQDLTLAISVINQIVVSAYVPTPSIWLSYCQQVDLFRCSFEVFVYMEQIEGRPIYAQQVLDMCLAMASATPRAAEQMALEGLMTALTNNVLTELIEAGGINTVSLDGQRTSQHEIWTSMLGLVVSLVSALGESTQFVEQEVTGFVRLYSTQIALSMGWNTETILTFPGLEEMQNAVALMHGLVRRGGGGVGLNEVCSIYIEQSLNLLQQVVYAVLHPNLLSGLIDAVSQEERIWIEKDVVGSTETDLSKRPVLGSVTLALLHLARGIIDSLLAYTFAFATLSKEVSEWRTDRAIVVPTAAVTVSEKASIGTLLDLASFCLDTLRLTSTTTAGPSTLLLSSPLASYSSERMISSAQQTLEATLVLVATQCALSLYKPDPSPSRSSTAMRREIIGELKGDLLSVLDKGAVDKGVKSKGKTSEVEMAKILGAFVRRNLVEN